MRIARLAARIGSVFQITPGLKSAVHGAAIGSAAALTAFTPAAHAAVVVSPAANIVVPATTAGIYINVVTGAAGTAAATAGWDINPWGSTTMSFFSPTAAGSVITGGSYVSGAPNSSVSSLLVGATIGGASTFTSSATAVTFGALADQWALNATNYFGFRFIGDDAQLHYGYGTMIMGASATVRTVGALYYESLPDTAITISAAVPEPSTYAMMVLGAIGVFGAVARRRKAA